MLLQEQDPKKNMNMDWQKIPSISIPKCLSLPCHWAEFKMQRHGFMTITGLSSRFHQVLQLFQLSWCGSLLLAWHLLKEQRGIGGCAQHTTSKTCSNMIDVGNKLPWDTPNIRQNWPSHFVTQLGSLYARWCMQEQLEQLKLEESSDHLEINFCASQSGLVYVAFVPFFCYKMDSKS